MNARHAAFISLKKYVSAQKYLNIETDAAIKKYGLEGAEKNLYTALTYGTVERMITLDYLIGQLSSKPIDKIDINVLLILRMSLYQLRFLDRIPDHAVCFEAGEMCRRFAATGAISFVNAVLREYIRQKDRLTLPKKEDGILPYLSVNYSVPEWLAKLWIDDYGESRAEGILRGSEAEPPYLTLRVNTLRLSREELLSLLSEYRIHAVPHPTVPTAITLQKRCSFEQLESIAPGAFFVQDTASQMAVLALDAKPGDTVFDFCAAPGSKSFGAAIQMQNRGTVRAFDLHSNKISLISKGAKQLAVSVISAETADASKPQESLFGKADRVICDVPCSGLGVLAKKPDIRHKQFSDIERLPSVQSAILQNGALTVRPGGILLYSTCTLRKDENENQIQSFLQKNPDFAAEPFCVGGRNVESGMLTLFPDTDKTDGFFIAKLRRRGAV